MIKEKRHINLTMVLVYWIILRASIINIVYAIVLLFVHPMVKTSATAAFMPFAGQSLSGIIFLIAGALSLVSIFLERKSHAMICSFSMITVLGYSAWKSTHSAIIGTFANGYTPDVHPHIFIATDQLLTVTSLVTYTIALIVLLSYKK